MNNRQMLQWLTLAVLLFLSAPALFAQSGTDVGMDINWPRGTHAYGDHNPRTGICMLTGGVIASFPGHVDDKYIRSVTQSGGCIECPPITIHFDEPVDNVRFWMLHANGAGTYNGVRRTGETFDIYDDLGHHETRSLKRFENKRVFWPHNGVRTIFIYPTTPNHHYSIDAIVWWQASKPAIEFRFGEDPNVRGSEPVLWSPKVVNESTKVRVPLGRMFTIRLSRINASGKWENIPSTFTLTDMRVANDGPARPEQTLYPEYPLFMFGSAPDAATRIFQSLRFGDAKLTIDPDDPFIPAVSFPIESAPPRQLGSSGSGNNLQWDGHIWNQADVRGIPPQYIKAIAAHESQWNIFSWRYEPGPDRKIIAPRRTTSPYADYVLPSQPWDGSIAMGRWLCPTSVNFPGCGFAIDDLAPKQVLKYRRGDSVLQIPPHDLNANITIREICNGNLRQGWHDPTNPDAPCPPPPPPPPPNMTSSLRSGGKIEVHRPRPFPPPDPYKKTANPHLASSYGLMQTTWYSVIGPNKIWQGATPPGGSGLRVNPALLFDTTDNIARGSASIIVGPNELRFQFVLRNYRAELERGDLSPVRHPIYETPADYRARMRLAVRGYNGGGDAATEYADKKVLPFLKNYEAIFAPNTPIVTSEGGGGGVICTAPPTVSAQSTNVTIGAGGQATLFVTSPDSETIRWFQGTVGDTSNLITTNRWVIVTPTTTASYWAELTNNCGVTNVPATVTIGSGSLCADASIESFSPDQDAVVGAPVELTATIAGTPAGYQWYSYVNEDDDWQIMPGANGPTLEFTAASSATYFLVVTSECATEMSPHVRVTVTPCIEPAITAQPSGSSIVAGTQATLSVGVSGSVPQTIQWKTASGATVGSGATIQVQPAQTTSYFATISNPCGSVTSATATVNVCFPPPITAQPQNVSITAGQSTTLSVTATGSGLTYQWYQNGAAIAGATNSSLTVTPAATATYSVIVRNSCGPTTSANATVTVCHPPSIATPPQNQSITAGQSTTLSVVANGSATLAYQWFKDGAAISGATGTSLTTSPSATASYTVRVTNGCGTANSAAATVTVCHPPSITTQPQNVSIIAGQTATLSVTASGSALTYQWYRNDEAISGATSASFGSTPAETANYKVVISNGCGSVTSSIAVVSVCHLPVIASHTQSHWITKGATRELTVDAQGADTYRWYRGTAPDTTNVVGNSFSTFVNPSNTTSYWARVSNSCGSDDTETIVISVCDTPVITAQPQSRNIFSGTSTTLSVTATQATTTPMTYQWYSGSGTANPIAGATSTTYTTPALTATATYWVRITAATCSVDSAPATVSMCSYSPTLNAPDDKDIAVGQTTRLSVNISPVPQQVRWFRGAQGDTTNQISAINYVDVSPAVTTQYWGEFTHDGCVAKSRTVTVYVSIPTITQQPASVQVNNGQTATLTASANTAGVTYQWYSGTSGSGTAISGATSASFTTPPMTTTTSYWVKVTGSRGHVVNSNTATVSVCVPASISTHPQSASIRRGSSASLSVTASGTNLRYQWYRATAPTEANPSGTTPSISVSPTDPSNYWVKVTGDCGTANSNTATVNVCIDPAINTQPASQTIYSGTTATLSVAATAGTALPLSYQWYSGTSGSGTPINGATAATYTTPVLTSTASYWVKVTSGVCQIDSNTATVSMCAYSPTLNAPSDRDIAVGETIRLSVNISPVPTSGKWYRGAQGVRTNQISSYTFADVSPATTTDYWGELTHDGCTTMTRTVTVFVSVPTITQQPAANTQVNGGQSATLTVAANTTGLTYQWYSGTSGSGAAIPGATGATFHTPALTAGSAASYWVKVTGSRGHGVNSNTASVTWCDPAVITRSPFSASIRRGSSVSMTVDATGTNLRYQWYRATSPNEVNGIASATSSQYDIVPLDSTNYWVKVTSDCGVAYSTTAQIDVCLDPTINAHPASQFVNSGSTATLSVTAIANTTLGLSYQWYSGTSGSGTAIPGETGPTFTTPPLTAAANYWVRVKSGVCDTNSNTAAISICSWPAQLNAPADRKVKAGVATLLSSSPTPTPQTWKWYRGAQGDRTNLISTQPNVNVYPTVTTQYWCEMTYNSCTTKTRTVTINVCVPTITNQPDSVTINYGTSTTLSVTSTEASTYQWYNGSTGQPITGATSPSYTTPVLYSSQSYYVVTTGSCGISTDSSYAYVTVD